VPDSAVSCIGGARIAARQTIPAPRACRDTLGSTLGFDPAATTPSEFGERIKNEDREMGKGAVRAAKIRIEWSCTLRPHPEEPAKRASRRMATGEACTSGHPSRRAQERAPQDEAAEDACEDHL